MGTIEKKWRRLVYFACQQLFNTEVKDIIFTKQCPCSGLEYLCTVPYTLAH